jgi:peptide/nickel transport system substrate-binding protein
MRKVLRSGAAFTALALAGVTALAACGKAKPTTPAVGINGSFGSLPAEATGPQHSGTITWAEPPGTAPNWILPIITSAADSVNDTSDFEGLMWRGLYWFGNGVEPSFNAAESLADPPKWSNGDTTVSITLKSNYKWSDGQPITSKDVLFFYDEVKAALKENSSNWGPYNPGLGIPDQVANVTTPSTSTIVFTLKKAVNPGWFWDDQLSNLLPLPAQSWAKASASGPILDFTNPANAKLIYNFLSKASGSVNTYASNPIWQVVDGPYHLTAFDSSTGAYTMQPNPSYGGPHAGKVSTFVADPFTSDTAEFDAVRAGKIDIGYLPLDDINQTKLVESSGYHVFGAPDFGFSYITYNFLDKTGDFDHIIAQLYIRQALAHLENESGYIHAFFGGAGGADYGPVPAVPKSPYTPSNAATDPYPYSIKDAISLLKSHGWTVNTGGTDVCAKAGSGAGECGAGIPAGTKLAFNDVYSSAPAVFGEMSTAWASAASSAGITIHLQSSNYNYIIDNYDNPVPGGKAFINKWATEDWGGYTDYTYPTQLGVFSSNGTLNEGSYANPQADRLIDASVNGGNAAAVRAEAAFLTEQQPGLFQPNGDSIVVWTKNISGPPDSFSNQTQFYLTPEFWYFTK